MGDMANLNIGAFWEGYSAVAVTLTILLITGIFVQKRTETLDGFAFILGAFFVLLVVKIIPAAYFFSGSDVWVFLELLTSCLAAVLLATGGLAMKGLKAAGPILTYVLFGICVLISVYIFFLSDASYLRYLVQYLTLTGGYVLAAVGFASLSGEKRYGFIYTTFGFALLAVYNLVQISDWGRSHIGNDFVFAALHFNLAFGFLLSLGSFLETEISHLEEEAAANRDRLRLIIQSSPFPIVISRLKDDRLLLANKKASEFLGLNPDKITDYRLGDFFCNPEARTQLSGLLEKSPQIEGFDVRIKSNTLFDEKEVWAQLSTHVIDFEYELTLYSAIQDISERKKKEIELFNEATRDSLTGAYTRRFFEELAKKEIQRSLRYNSPFCLIMIDADHFKRVNDTYGHSAGDRVLKKLVTVCEETLRKTDIISRFGGEEFLILLPETPFDKGKMVADRLRIIISESGVKGDHDEDIFFTVSMGLVFSSYSSELPALVKAVDEALYVAKDSGRNKVVAVAPTVTATKTDSAKDDAEESEIKNA